MKTSPVLALIALLPLGCAGAAPSAATPSQHPAAVTVVDLTPAAPPKPAEEPHLARDVALAEAAEFATLRSLNDGGSPVLKDGEPLPPDLLEPFPPNRLSRVAPPTNDPFGAGGVAGGVVGGGVGFGATGTLGAGAGTGQTFGNGSGRLGSLGAGSPPQVRAGAIVSNVGLPKEIIQRIVRQNFSRFRFCYEKGLLTHPKLQGTVVVRFVIDKDGAVTSVAPTKDTTLPDAAVSACVTTAFSNLVFPQPDGGGVVNVVYPIAFAPGEAAPTPSPAKPPPPPPPPAPAPAKKP